MELKEIMNLRKVREFYDSMEFSCIECPMKDICSSLSSCLIEKILGIVKINEDLYDMESNGELNINYQIPCSVTGAY